MIESKILWDDKGEVVLEAPNDENEFVLVSKNELLNIFNFVNDAKTQITRREGLAPQSRSEFLREVLMELNKYMDEILAVVADGYEKESREYKLVRDAFIAINVHLELAASGFEYPEVISED